MALLSFTRRLTPISFKYISLIMAQTLTQTDLHLPGQDHVYHGKVRDVYFLKDGRIVMVATDRISAFDVVLPEGIPYKGQVLNQIATYFLEATKDIVPNWLISSPDPMVSLGRRCKPFRIEMVIRGYLTGSAWRAYRAGERTLCGVELPEGMKENEAFASPIITPTTKEDEGHDENISKDEIIRTGLVSKEDYEQLEAYTYALFRRGQEMARERGLILVDTKYEFGKGEDGTIYLIAEIHTPDSSRQWLIKHGFQGRAGEVIPTMTPEYCREVSDRYIELYELVTGRPFVKEPTDDLTSRIEHNLLAALR